MRELSRRALLAAALVFGPWSTAVAAETVTIYAAASLKDAIDDAAFAFRTRTGIDVKASYAASSALVQQIDAGAPADIFASADTNWMDYAEQHALLQPATRVDLLGNTLVVVAPKASPIATLDLTPAAFDGAVGTGRWMTGTVNSVPCGIYAKEALTRLGLWAVAKPKLAQTDNVRSALAFVSRGEAALGIVYQTDANADPGVKVVATFPPDTHSPIIYPFALTKAAQGGAPAKFLAFLTGDDAKAIFEKQGFIRSEGR